MGMHIPLVPFCVIVLGHTTSPPPFVITVMVGLIPTQGGVVFLVSKHIATYDGPCESLNRSDPMRVGAVLSQPLRDVTDPVRAGAESSSQLNTSSTPRDVTDPARAGAESSSHNNTLRATPPPEKAKICMF